MSRTSCISHPAHEPLIVIHRWQLEFCKDDKGKVNECAAALLSFFEYWHNIKLEMSERNRAANDAFTHLNARAKAGRTRKACCSGIPPRRSKPGC